MDVLTHVNVLVGPAFAVGVGVTVIVKFKAVATLLIQPLAFVPFIVYEVVVVGLTVKLVPVSPPGNNVYVLAPAGVMVTVLPAHIVLELIEPIVTVGVGFTVTIKFKAVVDEFKQPLVFVPSIV